MIDQIIDFLQQTQTSFLELAKEDTFSVFSKVVFNTSQSESL